MQEDTVNRKWLWNDDTFHGWRCLSRVQWWFGTLNCAGKCGWKIVGKYPANWIISGFLAKIISIYIPVIKTCCLLIQRSLEIYIYVVWVMLHNGDNTSHPSPVNQLIQAYNYNFFEEPFLHTLQKEKPWRSGEPTTPSSNWALCMGCIQGSRFFTETHYNNKQNKYKKHTVHKVVKEYTVLSTVFKNRLST